VRCSRVAEEEVRDPVGKKVSRGRACHLLDRVITLQETAKSTRVKTLVDKDQALIDSLSTRA
jgi:hypothetical protein